MIRKLIVAAVLAFVGLGSSLAPAAAQSYRQPDFGYDRTFRGNHHVQGWVTSFSGFDLVLRIHGVGQPVNLHQGTVLRPLGLTMVPGMLVRADGYFNGNGLFIAEQITLIR